MSEITESEARTLLRKILSENPDRVNPTDDDGACLYNGPDGTHCIAGEAFVALGHDPGRFQERIGASDVGLALGLWSPGKVGEPLSVPAEMFRRVQGLADGGTVYIGGDVIDGNFSDDCNLHPRPWGEVLALAIEYDIL